MSMTTSSQCLECQAPVCASSPVALCGGCLLRLGQEGEEELLSSQPTRHSTSLPRRFGDYELLEQIGVGGMGIVYRARHLPLHRLVALKMLHSNGAIAPSALTRFKIEAEAAAMLEHPHIVSTYDAGEVDGQPYLSMRLIEGSSLAKRLADFSLASKSPELADQPKGTSFSRRARQERIAQLLIAVCTAVHYAHEHGVVHRDLKPNNILLDRDGIPHLSDFGIAKMLDRAEGVTRTSDIVGTPHYMSPEQALGKPVGPSSDIYSLGIILYELLTGKPPFRAASHLETLQQVLKDQPTNPTALNHSIDVDLATICLKCLEKAPQARYVTAEALAEDLKRWLHRELILARRATPPVRLHRWIRRNPVGTSFIVMLLCALGISLWLVLKLHESQRSEQRFGKELLETNDRLNKLVARQIVSTRERLQRAWLETEESTFVVKSEDLALLAQRSVASTDGRDIALYRVGLYLRESPVEDAETYGRLLGFLEERMTEKLNRRVKLDLHFIKGQELGPQALAQGDVDFMRLGTLPFLYAERMNPRVRPIAIPTSRGKPWVFFTHENKPLPSLQNAAQRSLALGDTNATISFWGLIKLAEAGIDATQLSKYDYLDPEPDWIEDVRMKGAAEAIARVGFLHSHSKVIDAVLSGEYDLGVASTRAFNIHRWRGLTPVPNTDFFSSPILWAASAKAQADAANAFATALFESAETGALESLPDPPLRFRPPTTNDLARERHWFNRIPVTFPPKPTKR
ncbi:MAG: protein kinase [Verrucomicrobiales bacterium]|nr:protein kinase [Verrucomicrobiales bacterium]